NIVREDVLNFDQAGNLSPNSEISTIYEYDELDRVFLKHQEVGNADLGPGDLAPIPDSEFISFLYVYDDAGNLMAWMPQAPPGEPVNLVSLKYDERGLLYRLARGADTLDRSIDQFDYDGNGNRIRVLLAPDFLRLQVTYDGHDRPVRVED